MVQAWPSGAEIGAARLGCNVPRTPRAGSRSFYLEHIERMVLDQLEREAGDPDVLAAYVAEFQAEKNALAATSLDKRTRLERDIAVGKREIARLIDNLQKGLVEGEDIQEPLKAAKAERDAVQAELSKLEPLENVLVIHPASVKKFAEQIQVLKANAGQTLAGDAAEAAKALRVLIDKIAVYPDPEKRGGIKLEMSGKLELFTDRQEPRSSIMG